MNDIVRCWSIWELKDLDPKVLAREMNVTVENLYNIRHRAVKQLIAVIREEEHYV